jgi:hypothetical protein
MDDQTDGAKSLSQKSAEELDQEDVHISGRPLTTNKDEPEEGNASQPRKEKISTDTPPKENKKSRPKHKKRKQH